MHEVGLRAGSLDDATLKRTINSAGYTIRKICIAPALRVQALYSVFSPHSANPWDRLTEAHAAGGDAEMAKALSKNGLVLSIRPVWH